MRPRTDRRRRWTRRWAERRGATENQRRCVRVPWRIIVRGYYYPRTFPFPKLSQTVINTNHFWDRSFSHFPSQIPIFSNQNIKFFQNNFVIFSDAVLLVEAGGRLPTGTRCRISCLQLSTTSCRHEKSARRRTRSGGPRPARTGAERRHRTFEPRIGLENKKERCFMHHSFLFISARRGSNPRPPPWQGGAPPLSHSRIMYRSKPVS